MQYRREIDGLRAVAVLPVILFHAGFSWFSGGYVGVDVFFVISGYLITTILLDDLKKGSFSIAKFYERRARRILPALFFVMLCCIPFAWMWMTPQQYKDFSQAFLAISFFSSNILFWREDNYFAPAAEENPLLHTWSLAVEEQFYIFFPLLLLLLWRFGKKPIFYVVLALSLFSLLLSEWGWRNDSSANFYLLPTRAWELGAGAICAILMHDRPVKSNQLLSFSGLIMIVCSVIAYHDQVPFPSVYTLLPVGGTALVILYGSKGTFTSRILSLTPFVWVGLISYSAYLWHQPLLAFARIRIDPHPQWQTMLGLSCLSIVLAYLSWRYVEKPFRARGSAFMDSRRKVFIGSAAASLAVISLGLYGHLKNGIPSRFELNEQELSFINTASASPRRDECHADEENIISPDLACRYNSDTAKIAVFGDSHTVELAYALSEKVKDAGIGVTQFSFSDCAPLYDADAPSICGQWTADAAEYIKESGEITHVVVSYRVSKILWGDHYGVYPDLPHDKDDVYRQRVISGLKSILEDLLADGKSVVFVDQSPELPQQIQEIVYSGETSNDRLKGVTRDWWEKRMEFFNQSDAIPKGVKRIRVDDLFCDREFCYAGENGISYYFDDDHISLAGAERVAEQVLKVITLTQNKESKISDLGR